MPTHRRALKLITGMHRSGTTLPGEILCTLPDLLYLHEPFNFAQGIDRLRHAYPYAAADGDGLTEELAALFDDAFALAARYRSHSRRDGLWKGLARRIVHGRSDLDQWRARYRMWRGQADAETPLLIKDPFLLLAGGHLAAARDARIVVMVRHPIAVLRSVVRMQWQLRFEQIAGPAFWRRPEHAGLDPAAIDRLPELDKLAHLWRLLNGHAALLARELPERVLLVRHEDFCVDPMTWLETIADHLGLTLGDPQRARVRAMTEGELVDPNTARQHHFVRDARSLAWAWSRRRDPDEEARVRPIVEDTVRELYGCWAPDTDA